MLETLNAILNVEVEKLLCVRQIGECYHLGICDHLNSCLEDVWVRIDLKEDDTIEELGRESIIGKDEAQQSAMWAKKGKNFPLSLEMIGKVTDQENLFGVYIHLRE